jgi:hypothetical protein
MQLGSVYKAGLKLNLESIKHVMYCHVIGCDCRWALDLLLDLLEPG